jgi:hypothetical protein
MQQQNSGGVHKSLCHTDHNAGQLLYDTTQTPIHVFKFKVFPVLFNFDGPFIA